MYNHHSGCHGNGEMFLYEWKEKAPYCVCIDLDCIFVSSKKKMKMVVLEEGSGSVSQAYSRISLHQ